MPLRVMDPPDSLTVFRTTDPRLHHPGDPTQNDKIPSPPFSKVSVRRQHLNRSPTGLPTAPTRPSHARAIYRIHSNRLRSRQTVALTLDNRGPHHFAECESPESIGR